MDADRKGGWVMLRDTLRGHAERHGVDATIDLMIAETDALNAEIAALKAEVANQRHEIGMLLGEIARLRAALAAGPAALRKSAARKNPYPWSQPWHAYESAAVTVEVAQAAAMKEGT